jgi:3-oxoadipate enol-lactonase
MHYEVHGAGPPLLLLMGLGCPGALWWLQVEAFAAQYRVIVPDNRGVGRTEKPAGPYSTALMADDTAHLLAALDISRAHVVGMSMGGAIAQQLALRHPHLVDRLVLACTFSESSPYGQEILAVWRLVAESAGMEALSRLLLLQSVTPRFYAAHADRLARLQQLFAAFPQPVEAYLQQNWACARHRTAEQLPRIRAPTLVLAAERDVLTPVGAMNLIHRHIPGSQFAVIPRCGHGFMWEVPEQFNAAIAAFLAA